MQKKTISYSELPDEICTIIFINYLLKDLSDSNAIKAAKNLSSTCKKQYVLLLNPIKKSFETFIFSNIDFSKYTIDDPLCNLFINILPTDFYSELLNKTKEEQHTAYIKINVIEGYHYLSEEKLNKKIIDLHNKISETTKTIENLSTELQDINSAKKPLLINAGQKELSFLKKTLKRIKTKKTLVKADLEIIKKREEYKNNLKTSTFFNYFFSQDESTDLPPAKFFKNWIEAKINLIYLFWARTLLQPLLYTDKYYNAHAEIIVKYMRGAYKHEQNLNSKEIINLISHTTCRQQEIETTFIKMQSTNIAPFSNYKENFLNHNYLKSTFFNTTQPKKTINLPLYIYLVNEQLVINLNWWNHLYVKAKTNDNRIFNQNNLKNMLLLWLQGNNKIQLIFYTACKLQYSMHKMIQYINDNNTPGATVTIKTVDGIEHFTQSNKRFLHCIQNNQYPNITFVFQVPEEKVDYCKIFFHKKPWLNWYNTLYYLNQDIGKGPNTWSKVFEERYDDLTGFWTRSGLLLFIWATLCGLQEDQSIISTSFVPCSLALQLLRSLVSTANEGSFFKHTVGAIPWYILHALLRDSLLLYSIYQYCNINYLVTAYTLFELWMVQKSLFYKPLFEALCKQYKENNTVTVTAY